MNKIDLSNMPLEDLLKLFKLMSPERRDRLTAKLFELAVGQMGHEVMCEVWARISKLSTLFEIHERDTLAQETLTGLFLQNIIAPTLIFADQWTKFAAKAPETINLESVEGADRFDNLEPLSQDDAKAIVMRILPLEDIVMRMVEITAALVQSKTRTH